MSLRFSLWHLSVDLALWAPRRYPYGVGLVRYAATVRWKESQRGYYSLVF